MPTHSGVKLIKLPATDLRASVRWYRKVFGAVPVMEFPDVEDGMIRGVAMNLPESGGGIALREDPQHAAGISGFNVAVWGVAGEADIDEWMAHLDRLSIDHSPKIPATLGWLLIFHDPDGIEHHLYSEERHGQDMSNEPRAGRPTTPEAWD